MGAHQQFKKAKELLGNLQINPEPLRVSIDKWESYIFLPAVIDKR